MKPAQTAILLVSAVALPLLAGSCSKPAAEAAQAAAPSTSANDPIQSAMAAAPAALGEHATIVAVNADGSMTTLREGTNGWTCMPDNPQSPGPDPMCMDANALKWGMAWMKHEEPPKELPGIMYMLKGGSDASNTDPFATQPAADGKWVETGPHMMLVGTLAGLAGYPSGPNPDTTQPYVMWSGTPYAHLMLPVE